MPKIGSALKKAVEIRSETDDDSKTKRRPASVLMNHNRRAVFQALCFRPCLTVSAMTSALSLSRATILWHLKTLMKADYVDGISVYRKDRYLPAGLITSEDDMIVFALLNDEKCGELYRAVVDNPGKDAKTLARITDNRSIKSSLRSLEDTKLITAVRDGRHLRYFPTDKVEQLAQSERRKTLAFQNNLLKRLKEEYLHPTLRGIKGRGLLINLEAIDEDSFVSNARNVISGSEPTRNKASIEIPYDIVDVSLSS